MHLPTLLHCLDVTARFARRVFADCLVKLGCKAANERDNAAGGAIDGDRRNRGVVFQHGQ